MRFRDLKIGDHFTLPYLVKDGPHRPRPLIKCGEDGALPFDARGEICRSDQFVSLDPDQPVVTPPLGSQGTRLAGSPRPGVRLHHAHAAPSRDEIRRAQMDEDSGQRADEREGRDPS